MGEILKATHQGELDIDGHKIEAYNLPDGRRVLSRIGFLRAIGRTGKAKGGRKYDQEFKTPVFLSASNIKPLITNKINENSKPVIFDDLQGNECIGYNADLLPNVVYLFASAFDQGILKSNQSHIGERCKILVKAFLNTAIIALVDEATGYQHDREAQELQRILKAYVSRELHVWQKRFPDEFYKQIFRLNGWPYTVDGIKKRPGVIGTWTNQLIYEQLPKGVLAELKRQTPKSEKGNRLHRIHQRLTPDIGNSHLQEQLTKVVTIMKLSTDWEDFKYKFEQLHGPMSIFFYDELEDEKVQQKSLSEFDKKMKKALMFNPKK